MNRRDVLFGLGCAGALGGAETLRPRRVVSLVGDRKLTTLIPVRFAGWQAEGGGDIVVPKVEGSLADTLYGETVLRTYRHPDNGPPVMLLVAHGSSQSDQLQLHRPEVCYQAIGFSIIEHRFDPVRLAGGVSLPTVELTAKAGGRVEDILYWTRLGEYLPVTAGEQRRDRLRTSMAGDIADGVLVRASAVREGEQPIWDRINAFTAAMVGAMAADARASLIGTERARAFAGGARTA